MRAPSERETILSNFDKTSRLRAGRLPGEGKRGQGDFDFPLSPLLNPVPLPNFQFVNGSRKATELANGQLGRFATAVDELKIRQRHRFPKGTKGRIGTPLSPLALAGEAARPQATCFEGTLL